MILVLFFFLFLVSPVEAAGARPPPGVRFKALAVAFSGRRLAQTIKETSSVAQQGSPMD